MTNNDRWQLVCDMTVISATSTGFLTWAAALVRMMRNLVLDWKYGPVDELESIYGDGSLS